MPPLVRKQPLSERLKTLLNPYDFLLYLSEELHESAIDEKLRDWTVPIGVAANFVYMIARANSANEGSGKRNDLFGDFEGKGGSGWLGWFASFTAHFLALLSILNALYLFTRTRKYRLFETSIDAPPTTPSARRVRVDSSPASASPLSYFSAKFANNAASRAHPDEHNDVWELAIWDPKPLHLSLFAMFSPGHVLIYWIFLPTSSVDARPSVTILTTIILAALMSAQLFLFKSFFERKAKDERVLNKEVLNEYDTKYVHPSLNRPVRDVGTQSRESFISPGRKSREVEVYTPTTIVNRGFKINPNPSYAQHLGDNVDTRSLYAETPGRRVTRMSSSLLSPTPAPLTSGTTRAAGGYTQASTMTNMHQQTEDSSFEPRNPSPQKQQQPVQGLGIARQRSQPSLSSSAAAPRDRASTGRSDGGSLGVFTHAASPLRKSTGAPLLRHQKSREGGMGSPLKRVSNVAPSTSGGRLDYLGRPIEPPVQRTERSLFGGDRGGRDRERKTEREREREAERERERERSDREARTSEDGLKARFGGLRDAGFGGGNGGSGRERRPY